MINLIPPVARRAVTKEYWIRVVSVWLFMLSMVLALILALQLPTYILIKAYSQALDTQFDTAEAMQVEFDTLEDEVKTANELVAHLGEQGDASVRFSELVYELDGLASDTVVLTQFSMQREAGEVEVVNIIGEAANRTALSKFRDAVEGSERFISAELPISNLAKDKDIVFSMKITMANEI